MTKEKIFMMYFAAGWKKIARNATTPVEYGDFDERCVIIEIENAGELRVLSENDKYLYRTDYTHSKLILRKFEDMTEEEMKEYINIEIKECLYKQRAITTIYLLSIGIDLFNAIEQGFAVHEKELK